MMYKRVGHMETTDQGRGVVISTPIVVHTSLLGCGGLDLDLRSTILKDVMDRYGDDPSN